MSWTTVGAETEIPVGEMKMFNVDDLEITVYHLDGGWYATADMCTHQDCSLAEGYIEGGEIVCDCHGGAFDIKSGAATRMPCVVALETFPVRVDDGKIQIDTDL